MPVTSLTVTSWIQEVERRGSPLGPVLYIRIGRYDEKPMPWEEVYERFAEAYPDRWAVQAFPPKSQLVDEVNLYHLFVLEEGAALPMQLRIDRPPGGPVNA